MTKGKKSEKILTCDVGANGLFDCELDGEKIEIHEVRMKNGHLFNVLTDPAYRQEMQFQANVKSQEKAQKYLQSKGRKPAAHSYSETRVS